MIRSEVNDSILVRDRRDPLAGKTQLEVELQLNKALKNRVEAAYFFGSFATNKMHSRSDVDLILVVKTDLPFVVRGHEFLDLYDVLPALDILVYTPNEFAQLTKNPSIGFWSTVTESMRRFI